MTNEEFQAVFSWAHALPRARAVAGLVSPVRLLAGISPWWAGGCTTGSNACGGASQWNPPQYLAHLPAVYRGQTTSGIAVQAGTGPVLSGAYRPGYAGRATSEVPMRDAFALSARRSDHGASMREGFFDDEVALRLRIGRAHAWLL